MACAPALPAEFADQPELNDPAPFPAPAPARRRRCGRTASKKACTKLAASPTRGMAIVMSMATVLAMTIAMLQLVDGSGSGGAGKTAAQTLYLAAGFNVLFTLLYTPLIGIFTLSSGFWRAVRTVFCTFFVGLAYTLGLLFISAAVLVGLATVFG
ncbi:MAG: hypothetical protein AAFV77_09100 [Planctomycetota bacterium]